MNADELFPPSEYLKSEDIDKAGGEMELTITSVGRKEYEKDGETSVKGVFSFSETKLKLTSNVTNTRAVIAMYGKDTDNWIGKKIVLYVDEHVQYAGKEVRGIRIRLIDEQQDTITLFWKKVKELGMTREDGLDHLKIYTKDNVKDFASALKGLEAPF